MSLRLLPRKKEVSSGVEFEPNYLLVRLPIELDEDTVRDIARSVASVYAPDVYIAEVSLGPREMRGVIRIVEKICL